MAPKEKKPMSPEKILALKKAQAAAKISMAERSPRAAGLERAKKALHWVYRWGWTTPSILEMVVDSFRSGIGNRLVKNGLLIKTATPSGGINNTPAFLLTLSEKGVDAVSQFFDLSMPYDPNQKINHAKVIHDELVQRMTVIRLRRLNTPRSDVLGFKTERELASKNSAGIKNPDCCWNKPHGEIGWAQTSIELELSKKEGRDLDQFVHASLLSLAGQTPRFRFLEIFFYSPTTKNNYMKAFQPGTEFSIWEKEPGRTGRWKKANTSKVPDWAEDRISFTLIEPWMLKPLPKVVEVADL